MVNPTPDNSAESSFTLPGLWVAATSRPGTSLRRSAMQLRPFVRADRRSYCFSIWLESIPPDKLASGKLTRGFWGWRIAATPRRGTDRSPEIYADARNRSRIDFLIPQDSGGRRLGDRLRRARLHLDHRRHLDLLHGDRGRAFPGRRTHRL